MAYLCVFIVMLLISYSLQTHHCAFSRHGTYAILDHFITCCVCLMMYMYMFQWGMRRKEKISKVKQTTRQSNAAHTPKAVTFPKKNELPRVGLEPTILCTLDRALYHWATKAAHMYTWWTLFLSVSLPLSSATAQAAAICRVPHCSGRFPWRRGSAHERHCHWQRYRLLTYPLSLFPVWLFFFLTLSPSSLLD